MAAEVTLEEVERLADRLPSQEQLNLVAHICEHLSEAAGSKGPGDDDERLAAVDAWLTECDAFAQSVEGEFDSAVDVRRIRAERSAGA